MRTSLLSTDLGLTPTRSKGGGGGAGRLGAKLRRWWPAFRTDLIDAVDGKVSAWRDTVVGEAMIMATDAAKPIWSATSCNGLPGVSADGVTQYLSHEGVNIPTGAAAYEVWLLIDQQADPGDGLVRIPFAVGGTASTNRRSINRAIFGGNRAQATAGTGTVQLTNTNTTMDFTGVCVVRAIYGPTGVTMEVNGVAGAETPGVLATGTTRMRFFAGTPTTPANFAQCVLGEVIICDLLTDAEAAMLRRNLMAKAAQPGESITDDSQLWVSVNSTTKTAHFAWKHDDAQMMKVTVAAVTFNDLPTVQSVSLAPLGNPASASWSQIFAQTGDWFGPMVIAADAGGDGSTSGNFTGGNHGSNGDATGDPTAALNSWAVTLDGVAMTGTSSGFGSSAELVWDLDLQGYNTVSLGRMIANQAFTLRASPGALEVTGVVTALEAVTVTTDYGLQMSTTGYQSDLHFWGGDGYSKITGWTGVGHNSGPSSSFTTYNVAAVSGANGWQASWLDQDFGLGDGSAIGGANPRMLQATTNKVYQGVVRSAKSLSLGASYSWRGGYSWAPSDMAGATLEASLRRTVSGETEYVGLFPAAGSGAIHARANDADKAVTVDGVPGFVTAGDISVSATGYAMVKARVTG